MGKIPQNIRLALTLSVGALAMAACSPKYASGSKAGYGMGYGQTAYAQAGGAYGAYSQSGYANSDYAQAGYYQYGGGQTHQKPSRYGYEIANSQTSLRPACNQNMGPCGFMRVLPVYPVYQVVTAPQAEPVTVAEVPTVTLPEPEPIVIQDPAPIYEPYVVEEPVFTPPVHHWPETQAEVPSWKPLRK